MTTQEVPKKPEGRLAVAVGFDEQTGALMKSAISFARKFNYSLLLIHVIEGPDFDPLAVDLPGYYTIPPVMRESESQLRAERQEQMRKLLDSLDPAIAAEGRVHYGDGPRVVIEDAKNSQCNAIMTACNLESYHLMPAGFSMALTLMNDAPMPVLVVSNDAVVDFSKQDFRILLTDDLQESNKETARRAYEFATALSNGHLRHLHVHGDFRELMRDAMLDIVDRSPLAGNGERPESIWLKEYNARLDQMKAQGEPFTVAAEEKGVVIERDVRTGKVADEVHAAIEDFDPDLIFYGRHRFWRTKPFFIGRMPFRSMLEEKKAVCMVPNQDEMYAALSLP